jgi:hypothetical protein
LGDYRRTVTSVRGFDATSAPHLARTLYRTLTSRQRWPDIAASASAYSSHTRRVVGSSSTAAGGVVTGRAGIRGSAGIGMGESSIPASGSTRAGGPPIARPRRGKRATPTGIPPADEQLRFDARLVGEHEEHSDRVLAEQAGCAAGVRARTRHGELVTSGDEHRQRCELGHVGDGDLVGRRRIGSQEDFVGVAAAAQHEAGHDPGADVDLDDGAVAGVGLGPRRAPGIGQFGRQGAQHRGDEPARLVPETAPWPAHAVATPDSAAASRRTRSRSSAVESSDSHASPWPTTRSASACLSSISLAMRSSTVPSQTSLWTRTV